MSNLRRFSRINFHATSFLKFKGESTQVELENISMKGALIQPLNSTDAQLGDIVSLEMKLNSSEITLIFEAQVVHMTESHIGLKFLKSDADSMIHLRAMLEANTGEPDKIRDELAFLLDL